MIVPVTVDDVLSGLLFPKLDTVRILNAQMQIDNFIAVFRAHASSLRYALLCNIRFLCTNLISPRGAWEQAIFILADCTRLHHLKGIDLIDEKTEQRCLYRSDSQAGSTLY